MKASLAYFYGLVYFDQLLNISINFFLSFSSWFDILIGFLSSSSKSEFELLAEDKLLFGLSDKLKLD